MTDSIPAGASIRRTDASFEIQLERSIDHAIDTVWRMLTDSAELPRWLAPGEIEAVPGGRARIDFGDSGAVVDSRVQVCEPPRRLVFSWSSGSDPERPVCWTLEPTSATRSLLRLTLQIPADEDAAKAAAGWDSHLEMLLAALEGVPIRFPVDHFLSRREAFRTLTPREAASR